MARDKRIFQRSLALAICVGIVVVTATGARAQNLFFSYFHGSAAEVDEITTNGAGITIVSTSLALDGYPNGLAFDAKGDLFIANGPDSDNAGGRQIVEVSSNNITGFGSYSIFSSSVVNPFGLAFDKTGNLFASDRFNGTIYEFTNYNGTIVSNLNVFATGLTNPDGLAFDSAGDLFEADAGSGNIYEFTNGNGVLSQNPMLFASGLKQPAGLAFNDAGNLFEADEGSGNVYEFNSNGVQSTFVSGLQGPTWLGFNKAGIFFMMTGSNVFISSVFEITPNGQQSIVASGFYNGGGIAFQGEKLPVFAPVVPRRKPNLFACEASSSGIAEITPAGQLTTFASGLSSPFLLAFDRTGDLFVYERGGIYEYPLDGIPSTFFSRSPITPGGMAISSSGNLFYSVPGNNVIYEITTTGVESTFASTSLRNPLGLAFDSAGDLFVANNGSILEYTNYIGTLSSNPTVFASPLNPTSLAFDSSGDLFETDSTHINEFTNYNGTLSPNPTQFGPPVAFSSVLTLDGADNLFVGPSGGGGEIYEINPSGAEILLANPGGRIPALAFPPMTTLKTIATNGIFQLFVTMPSTYYNSNIVEASTDLVNWTAIYTNTAPFTFTDSTAAVFPYRFYRGLIAN